MIKQILNNKLTRIELDNFLSKHKSEEYTLDLGCGNSPYRKYFPNRVGFDFEKKDGVDVVGDIHKLPFEDEKFDIILCTEVLEHLHSPEIAINEMKRVLKKNGTLILTTRFIFPIHDSPHDYYRYTKYGLLHLFRDWEIIELIEEAGTVKTMAILIQRIAFQTKLFGGKVITAVFLLFAKLFSKLSFIIKEEFGNTYSEPKVKEKSILVSGYYMICRKK